MIIITTCNKYPEIGQGLQLIVDALTERGQVVRCLPWQHRDLSVFCQAKSVLPLCAWDYTEHAQEFSRWLNAVQAGGGHLINGALTLQRNMKKTYLLALEEKGLRVTPTRYLEYPSYEQLATLSQSEGWHDMVVKPVFGQSGHGVWRYRPDMPDQHDRLTAGQGVIVQPFIESISRQGELALCFIAGEFSHAMCRMPAKGEWRANSQYQASVYQVDVSSGVIDQASSYLSCLDETPLYARVDGVVIEGAFVLCELELIEPALFFERVSNLSDSQFERFIDLLADSI